VNLGPIQDVSVATFFFLTGMVCVTTFWKSSGTRGAPPPTSTGSVSPAFWSRHSPDPDDQERAKLAAHRGALAPSPRHLAPDTPAASIPSLEEALAVTEETVNGVRRGEPRCEHCKQCLLWRACRLEALGAENRGVGSSILPLPTMKAQSWQVIPIPIPSRRSRLPRPVVRKNSIRRSFRANRVSRLASEMRTLP
jgi:hypothetical protein